MYIHIIYWQSFFPQSNGCTSVHPSTYLALPITSSLLSWLGWTPRDLAWLRYVLILLSFQVASGEDSVECNLQLAYFQIDYCKHEAQLVDNGTTLSGFLQV